MKSRKLHIAILLLFLVIQGLQPGLGQTILQLQQCPSENRISENASRCFFKDSKGLIWVGTIDGLNRYDGYRFRIYQNDPRDSNSISGNYITCIKEDQLGNLWVGTNNGLNRYLPGIDGFEQFKLPQLSGQSQSKEHITKLFVDTKHQRLWVASYGGLRYYDHRLEQFFAVPFSPEGNTNSIVDSNVTAICQAVDEGFWVGYQNGQLSKYENKQFVHYPPYETDNGVNDLLAAPDGRLWVGANKGVFLFDSATGQTRKYHHLRTWNIYTIDDETWFNINFDGIHKWNPAKDTLEQVTVMVGKQQAYGDIKAFFKDERGIIWGSYHGLFKQDSFEQRFKAIKYEKGNPNGLSEAFVSGLGVDDQGNWVAVTVSQGLNYYDRKNHVWFNHQNHHWFDNAFREDRLYNLKVFGHLALVLGTKAIYEFNLRNGQLRTFPFPGAQSGKMNGSIIKAGKNAYWISGGGLFLLNTNSGEFEDFTPDSVSKEPSSFVLHKEDNGLIWLAMGRTIYELVVTKSGREIKEVFRFKDTGSGFEEAINAFTKDNKGQFWVGRRNGLEVFNTQDSTFKHYSIVDGLPSNSINSILIDEAGRLWMGTNNGLSCFDPQTEVFRNYDRHDGIQDEIFLGNAAFKAPDGMLFFGGVSGFNYFMPDEVLVNNPYPPKILIQDFKIFNKSITPGEASVLSAPISETERLELSYKHSTISFELLALGYSQSAKNQYAYKMEGVDPHWNYVGSGQTASYTGLPRGRELLFKAKASNHDGIWTEEPVVLSIYIRPPFWQTSWFRGLMILTLFGLAFWYYRWRVRSIKLRNLWLEKEVKKQTADLEKANSELREQAVIIKNQMQKLDQLYHAQSRFFTSLSHEFRTPLTLLLGNLEELSQSKTPEKIIQKVAARMKMSTNQLLHLVNQLMDTAKLESGQYSLTVTNGNMLDEVQNLFNSFHVLANKKALELTLVDEIAKDASCWFDQDILFKVLNNLIANAIKFTEKGSIQLRVAFDESPSHDQLLFFELKDTGCGINPSELRYVFDRFYQVEGPLSARKKGTGIGLSLVKQLVELHKGRIELESEIGKGTTAKLWLPVGEKDFSAAEKSSINIQQEITLGEWRKDDPGLLPATEGSPVIDKEAPLVLIAEDNAEIRSFIVRQLRQVYRILEAENGAIAWEMAAKHVPDLVVSDVIMPELNGFGLCDKVKSDERTSHIPFILLTALAEQEKKVEGLKRGADAYLSKPFSKQELLLRVANLIEVREKLKRRFLKEYSLELMPEGLGRMEQAFLKKVNALIEANLANEQFGIDQMIKSLGVSRTQLFRKLKSLTGMSATEFIRDYRLRKAYHLLTQETKTVSEVIHATGFNSRSYFYNSFKEKFGMAPGKVRKD